MVIGVEVDSAIRDQNLNEAVWISHGAKTLGENMNPIILPLAIVK